MAKIQSVTLSYSNDEDRIHLALLLDGGPTMGLWLTQRIARTLVTTLANHMEKAEGIPLPMVRNVLMAQEQAVAVSAIRPATPVTVEGADGGHRIREINVSLSPDYVSLAFASDLDIKPAIVLDRTHVRQWLSMLHRQFVAGGWPQDVWPGWLLETDTGQGAGATRH